MDQRVYRIFNNTVLAILALAVVSVWLAVFSRPNGLLRVRFCDIGQGDAIFITTPQNRKILIDGGPDGRVLNCLSRALPFYDRTLDLVVLTHPHADHAGGLVDVISSYNVGAIVHNQIDYQSVDYQEFLKQAAARQIPVTAVFAGEQITLDSSSSLAVWHPKDSDYRVLGTSFNPFDGDDVNDSSLILSLVCGDFAALFTGDAPNNVQEFIFKEGTVSSVDVLKVAHHGGRDGIYSEFLKKLNPQLAVISLGADNRYGHPHKETLEKLQNAGVQVKRTDLDGAIEVVSDCKTWWLN